jgi:hypothetical protein
MQEGEKKETMIVKERMEIFDFTGITNSSFLNFSAQAG